MGQENYRMTLCILFSNKQMANDYNTLKALMLEHNITSDKHPKIQAMMLVKCNKTLPLNLTAEASWKAEGM